MEIIDRFASVIMIMKSMRWCKDIELLERKVGCLVKISNHISLERHIYSMNGRMCVIKGHIFEDGRHFLHLDKEKKRFDIDMVNNRNVWNITPIYCVTVDLLVHWNIFHSLKFDWNHVSPSHKPRHISCVLLFFSPFSVLGLISISNEKSSDVVKWIPFKIVPLKKNI